MATIKKPPISVRPPTPAASAQRESIKANFIVRRRGLSPAAASIILIVATVIITIVFEVLNGLSKPDGLNVPWARISSLKNLFF